MALYTSSTPYSFLTNPLTQREKHYEVFRRYCSSTPRHRWTELGPLRTLSSRPRKPAVWKQRSEFHHLHPGWRISVLPSDRLERHLESLVRGSSFHPNRVAPGGWQVSGSFRHSPHLPPGPLLTPSLRGSIHAGRQERTHSPHRQHRVHRWPTRPATTRRRLESTLPCSLS